MLKNLFETIDGALRSAGIASPGAARAPWSALKAARGAAAAVRPAMPDLATVLAALKARASTRSDAPPEPVAPVVPVAKEARVPASGSFTRHRHVGPAGAREYRLYLPSTLPAGPVPLVAMLHGCKQSAGDFATGTRMNALAERFGVIVVYPEQSARANGSNCWNWFDAADQARDHGEPAILAGIVREVIASHPVDPRRVHVAGLSAGAAMAVILGHAYPELFAAVGVHSGLPYAAAHDVGSAFAAMGGRSERPVSAAAAPTFVPTIVFHGDHDRTVAAVNADLIVAQALASRPASAALQPCVLPEARLGGRGCLRTLYLDASGRSQLEHWVVRGGGHAWSGGDPAGSFADAEGPDASAEMLKFFLDR